MTACSRSPYIGFDPRHSFEKSERLEMTDTPSTPGPPPRPKRGALPTPKSDIEEAQPYVPDVDESAESVDGEPTSAEVEGEAER